MLTKDANPSMLVQAWWDVVVNILDSYLLGLQFKPQNLILCEKVGRCFPLCLAVYSVES